MSDRVFLGFGFGAIQGGLFLYEAHRTRCFQRLVVAEVVPEVVTALRRAGGRYRVNVATPTGVVVHEVTGVEVFNPQDPADRVALVAAVTEATELATALPSVDFFARGEAAPAAILAEGLTRKLRTSSAPAVLYAGENHNHAAEILDRAVRERLAASDAARLGDYFQPLNTVIGKMSRVVVDPAEIREEELTPLTDDLGRALLVEEFNRILISRITLPGVQRGIEVFTEKPDLLPFEEAKLYGHNAVHALLGYLAHRRGYRFMFEAGHDQELMALARAAFLEESGPALIAKRGGVDPLFTPEGYRAYAEDLLTRMVNPFLRDAVGRVIRDPRRKLAWDDRLVGTMRLALDAGLTPRRFALGAAAALALVAAEEPGKLPDQLLAEIIPAAAPHAGRVQALIREAMQSFRQGGALSSCLPSLTGRS